MQPRPIHVRFLICSTLLTGTIAFNFPGNPGAQEACKGFSKGSLKCLTDVSFVVCNDGNEYEQFFAPGTSCIQGIRCQKKDYIEGVAATATNLFHQDPHCLMTAVMDDSSKVSTKSGVQSTAHASISQALSGQSNLAGSQVAETTPGLKTMSVSPIASSEVSRRVIPSSTHSAPRSLATANTVVPIDLR